MTLRVMHALARTLLEAKQAAKALPILGEFLDRERKRLGAESRHFIARLAAVGQDLLNHKQYAEAEARLRECLTLREKTQPDDWPAFDTRSMLGEALLGQGKHSEAEPLLLQGYRGMKERKARMPPALVTARLTEVLKRLVQLYDATSKPAEAARWQAELNAQTKASGKAGTPTGK